MNLPAWDVEFPAAITVCDTAGTVLALNDRAVQVFEQDGGLKLVGTNALDCHPEPARSKFKTMLASGQKNCYTVEKNGIKKMILQSPWYQGGQYAGFVEFAFEIPFELPHFVRS